MILNLSRSFILSEYIAAIEDRFIYNIPDIPVIRSALTKVAYPINAHRIADS
jgi:hypothetical protein